MVTDEDLKSFKIIKSEKNFDSISFKSDGNNIINERRICSEEEDERSGTVFES